MEIEPIALDALHAHPRNSNVMPAELFDKLVRHLERTDHYPPLIVRRHGEGYQLIDGHHRAAALRRLGRTHARCVVWDVDDDETLLLLATLNRLQGTDDPRKRAALLRELSEKHAAATLAAMVPDSPQRLERLVALASEAPAPRPAHVTEGIPVAVHFFLLPDEKRALEAALASIGGTRETALMSLVTAHDPDTEPKHGQTDE